MSSSTLAKESPIEGAMARLEKALERLDGAVVNGAKPGAVEDAAAQARLEAENAKLKDLNREAAQSLSEAIRRLETLVGIDDRA